MQSDRPLPANPERELQLIGAVLSTRNERDRRTVIASTPSEAFTDPRHRQAWQIITDLANAGALDEISFAAACAEQIEDGHAAAERYLAAYLPANAQTVDAWASELRELAHRRRVIHTYTAAVNAVWDGHEDPGTVETSIAAEHARNMATFGPQARGDMAETVEEFSKFCDTMEARRKAGRAVTFGIDALDNRCRWIPSYGLWLARTSHGKTALMANVALNQAMAGAAPVVFSLEQPAYQVVARLVCLLTGRPFFVAMNTGTLAPADAQARAEAMDWLAGSRLTIIDGRHAVASIEAHAHRLKAAGKCDVLYIDQASRLDHQQRRGETKEQAWTRSSNALARLWQEIDAPIVLLAQLNAKDAKDYPLPSPSHVKDCGSLLEDSCWQFVIDRPEAEEERFTKQEAQRAKLIAKGEHNDAAALDYRGKVGVSCTKDRNATMGGTWSVKLDFDRTSGGVGRPVDNAQPEERF